MDALHLKTSLEKVIAILPGSRDRRGGPIIIFPAHGELVEYPFSEVAAILGYLCQIPDDKCCGKGFTVLIDMRQSWVKYLKTVMKASQHVLRGKIQQIIIIKPEQFIEKQKINLELRLETYGFPINVVSVGKLSKFVDLNQMPFSFFGTYAYDHNQWIELRLKYEAYVREGSQVLRRIEYHLDSKQENLIADPSDDVNRTASLLQANEAYIKGQHLMDDLKGCTDQHIKSKNAWPNPDHLLAASRVETLCQQIRSVSDRVRGRSVEQIKLDKNRSDQIVVQQFLIGISNVSDWLSGPGNRWLQALREIGESRDEADQIRREHENLENRVQEVIHQVADLKSMADEILTSPNCAKNSDILAKREQIESLSKLFMIRLQHQTKLASLSLLFHGQVEEFSTQLDELLDSLCSEASINDVSTALLAIQSLDVRLATIDKLYEELCVESEGFLDKLALANKDVMHLSSLCGSESDNSFQQENSATSYLSGILHVKRILIDINERKQRCDQLSDVRRLKLQQTLQLLTCENDIEQAMDWLRELLEMMTQQYTKSCNSVEDIFNVKKDHQKVEHTARSTYEYGRQLLQISLVLRRTLRLEISKNSNLAQRMDVTWSKFCLALSERLTRLNLTQSFFISLKQMSSKLENLFAHLNQAHEGLNSAEEKSLSISKQIFIDDLRELMHVGKSLIQRLDLPLLPHSQDIDENTHQSTDKKTAEEVQCRLTEIQEKALFLNDFI